MLEMLQILKFRLRNDQLSFTEDLICTEEELSVVDIPASIVEEMMATGKIKELTALIEESWDAWPKPATTTTIPVQ